MSVGTLLKMSMFVRGHTLRAAYVCGNTLGDPCMSENFPMSVGTLFKWSTYLWDHSW